MPAYGVVDIKYLSREREREGQGETSAEEGWEERKGEREREGKV